MNTISNIEEKYPSLFQNCIEFYCDKEWLDSINLLCGIIEARNRRLNLDVQIVQIKVKFGYPRIYLLQHENIAYKWTRACEKHIIYKYK